MLPITRTVMGWKHIQNSFPKKISSPSVCLPLSFLLSDLCVSVCLTVCLCVGVCMRYMLYIQARVQFPKIMSVPVSGALRA